MLSHQQYIMHVHNYWAEQHRQAWQLQNDYGKWLITSLTAVHAGALFAIGTNQGFKPYFGSGVLWWFVVGLMLALFCGFTTWINWQCNARVAASFARPDFLLTEENDDWPKPSWFWVKVTYWASIGFGLISVACIPFGAWAVSDVIK